MKENIIIFMFAVLIVMFAIIIYRTPTTDDVSFLLDSKFEIEPYVESN